MKLMMTFGDFVVTAQGSQFENLSQNTLDMPYDTTQGAAWVMDTFAQYKFQETLTNHSRGQIGYPASKVRFVRYAGRYTR